eukprot:CAMPEP_0206474120 /NCGR_PEP_ID=MMETSP0324_2-20121206/33285_1 /ASSEMBLY_ACC=CAM_ASM_000836 /TAXON_ID=2866 /ORGANISM="Crypthecodinium cohnii, Strain Seligo" /LENGTH=158 /DNA_ID=CAMNT_0053949207 /DNA_START=79 /DNA_END=551 /DNA_ORIENTATION=+
MSDASGKSKTKGSRSARSQSEKRSGGSTEGKPATAQDGYPSSPKLATQKTGKSEKKAGKQAATAVVVTPPVAPDSARRRPDDEDDDEEDEEDEEDAPQPVVSGYRQRREQALAQQRYRETISYSRRREQALAAAEAAAAETGESPKFMTYAEYRKGLT